MKLTSIRHQKWHCVNKIMYYANNNTMKEDVDSEEEQISYDEPPAEPPVQNKEKKFSTK